MYNEGIRKKIVNSKEIPDCKNSQEGINLDDLITLIETYLPTGFDYACRICTETNCIITNVPREKDVYVTDVLISSTMESQNIKIVRIAFWLGE